MVEEEGEKRDYYEDSAWQHFVAGTVAGMSGVVVGYPFDTVKVRMQTQQTKLYHSSWECVRKTLRREGVRGFYKGMTAPLLGDALTNSIIFGVYGTVGGLLRTWTGLPDVRDELPLSLVCLSGLAAGTIGALIISPVELVKARLQVQTDRFPNRKSLHRSMVKYKGPIDVIRKTLKSEGLRGLTTGLGATFLRDVPSFAIYFTSWEAMRRAMTAEDQSVEDLSALQQLLAGGLAGVVTWLGTYWADVLKSRLQTQSMMPRYKRYDGILDCLVKSYQTRGIEVFFKGMETSIIRAFPTNCVLFFVYDFTLEVQRKLFLSLSDSSSVGEDIPPLPPVPMPAQAPL